MYAVQDFLTSNKVKLAIDRVGGQTLAAATLRVSGATVQNWIKAGRVPNLDKARALAKLSGMELQQLRSTW